MSLNPSPNTTAETHGLQFVAPDKHSPGVAPLLYPTQVPHLSTEQQETFSLINEVPSDTNTSKGWSSQLESLQGNLEYHTLLSTAPTAGNASYSNNEGYFFECFLKPRGPLWCKFHFIMRLYIFVKFFPSNTKPLAP